MFLPGAQGEVLRRGLPPPVYARLAAAFDANYPAAVRCRPGTTGCWQDEGAPDSLYAFSADGIWRKSAASRAVSALDFSDPVRLKLGFVNERRYNWLTVAPDVHRDDRDRRFFMGLKRWRIAMPWFEMVRLPAGYAGGELCWRGEVLWEGERDTFAALPGEGCRAIAAADAGKRVFGLAIKPDTLSMHVTPPWRLRLLRLAQGGAILIAALALVAILVRMRPRRALLAAGLIGLAAFVIAVDDASFLGGVRPFDGGDDGLFYDGVGREILQSLLAGDFYSALRGGESVYWYGGPGLRYFRALEHVVFGESYLGYLSLVLAFPFFVLLLFRRFLDARWALALVLLFVALPLGVLFGTSFVQYEKWASHGFADPAAYILFVAGVLPIVGAARAGPRAAFAAGFVGALLLALAIFMRPVVAPAAAVLLGGAGLAALGQRQWTRLSGLCLGFLPVFSMALHNWYFGHVFVPLSSNAADFESAGDAALGLCRGGAATHPAGFQRARARIAATRRLAERAGGILLDHSAQRRRRRHLALGGGARPRLRSLAAAARRGGAGAARRRAVLSRRRRPLSFPHLAAHFGGGDGLFSRAGNSPAGAPVSGAFASGRRAPAHKAACLRPRPSATSERMSKPPTGIANGLTNYGDPRFLALSAPLVRAARWAIRARCWRSRWSASPTRASGFNNCHRHFPELIEAVKRGVLAAGGAADRVPDDLARRGVPQPDQPDVPQPDGDRHRGDDPRPADGRGGADRRLRQDRAGAADGRGLGRPAGDHAGRRADDDRRATRASGSAPAPIAAASGRSYRAGEVDAEEIDEVEGKLATTAGTCAVMGTASHHGLASPRRSA